MRTSTALLAILIGVIGILCGEGFNRLTTRIENIEKILLHHVLDELVPEEPRKEWNL